MHMNINVHVCMESILHCILHPLKVEPFASLVTSTKFDVPRVLMNREIVGPFKHQRRRTKDIALTGDISERITELVRLSGWTKDLKELMKPPSPPQAKQGLASPTDKHSVISSSNSSSLVTDTEQVVGSHAPPPVKSLVNNSKGGTICKDSPSNDADDSNTVVIDIVDHLSKLDIKDKR